MRLRSLLLGLLIFAFSSGAVLADQRQDPFVIRDAVESFLRVQAAGLPGQVSVVVGAVDARLKLPACAALEPTLPPGSRPWGRITVVVRCAAPNPWTVYVSASVKVVGDYVVSARPLAQGQTLALEDLATRSGDLSQMPPGIVTDPAQAVGRTLAASLAFGSPLRQDLLRTQAAVMQNQSVKLVSSGRGFSVSAEGKALNSAQEGQVVQVWSASGRVVSGVARAGAVVEVAF